jgi:hypothetical protein
VLASKDKVGAEALAKAYAEMEHGGDVLTRGGGVSLCSRAAIVHRLSTTQRNGLATKRERWQREMIPARFTATSLE